MTTWIDGDVITVERLNDIEKRIDTNTSNISKLASGGTVGGGTSAGGSAIDYPFDLRYIPASSHGQIMATKTKVNQGIGINSMTGELFASRVFGDSGTDCAIAKLKENGSLDKEVVISMGEHGTCFGVEPVWNNSTKHWDSYIWTHVKHNGNNAIMKFNFDKFENGATVTTTSSNTSIINIGTTTYALPSVDYANDLVGFCMSSGGVYHVEVYKLSELNSGTVNRIGRVTLSQKDNYLQGFAIAEDRIYHRVGNADGSEADRLYVYNWTNDMFLYEINTSLLEPQLSSNNITSGHREPEGMCVYINPQTNKKSLFVCTTIGAENRRVHLLHAYHQDVGASLVGRMVGRGQQCNATAPDGTLKDVPNYITRFADITEYGEYYLTSAEFNRMTDRPVKTNSAGWYLYVSGHRANSDDAEQVQRLVSNAQGSFCEFIRFNRYNGATDWRANSQELLTEVDTYSKIASYNHYGVYYLTTAQLQNMTDLPPNWISGGYFLEVSPRNDSGVFIQTMTKNGVSTTPVVYKRVVTSNGASPWGLVNTSVVVLSQTQYNELKTKDSSTIYVIR